MSTVGTHFAKWKRGLDLGYFGGGDALAEAAFTAGFNAALGDTDAIAKALGGKLEHMNPELRAKAEGLARSFKKR